jgi:hypothetical protein
LRLVVLDSDLVPVRVNTGHLHQGLLRRRDGDNQSGPQNSPIVENLLNIDGQRNQK